MFVGRKEEVKEIKEALISQKFESILLYGRRRVGKTEIIKEALKEAVYNDVKSLKYIDRILYTWKQKGIKTKEDIIKDKRNFRNSKKTKEVFDYNWLEEDD